MNDGSPAFEAMMMITVEQIRRADGSGCAGGFNRGESRMIIHNFVGQKDFIAATAAKVESGCVVEGAGGSDRDEEKIVLAIPEAVFRNWV